MSHDDPYGEDDYHDTGDPFDVDEDRDDPYRGDVYRSDAEYERDPQYEATDEGDWFGMGTGMLLIVAGVALIVFPEPATSTLGVVLFVGGALLYGYEALT